MVLTGPLFVYLIFKKVFRVFYLHLGENKIFTPLNQYWRTPFMYLFKTKVTTLLQLLSMLVFFSCEKSDSHLENFIMEQPVYTLGVWYVQEDQQQEFIIAWKRTWRYF